MAKKKRYNKVTKEMKESMKQMRDKGLSYKAISKVLCLATSTIQYHIDKKSKKKAIKRSIKNQKPRDRTEYNKNYMSERYNSDEEFKERVRKHAREWYRRQNGNN